MTFGNLIDILSGYHIEAKPFATITEINANASLPCVAAWGKDHFVVVVKLYDNGDADIYNPTSGAAHVSTREFEAEAKYFLLVQDLGDQNKEEKHIADITSRNWKVAFREHVAPHAHTMFAALALTFLLEISNIAAPQLIASTINHLIGGEDFREVLTTFVLGYALATLLAFLFNRLRGKALVTLDVKIRFSWFDKVISHLVRLPESYFQTRATGETLSKLQSINAITHFYSGSLVEAALNGFFAICIVAVLCMLSLGYGLIWFVSSLLYVGFRAYMQPRVLEATRDAAVATAKQEGFLFETVQILRPLRSFGVLGAREPPRVPWRLLGLSQASTAVA